MIFASVSVVSATNVDNITVGDIKVAAFNDAEQLNSTNSTEYVTVNATQSIN
jgi:hypothetical protein